MSLEHHIEFWTDTLCKPIKTQAALIPAGQSHISANSFSKAVAVCYLDPFQQDYAAFQSVFSNCIDNIYFDLDDISRVQGTLKQIFITKPAANLAYQKLLTNIFPGDDAYLAAPTINQKIDAVINSIKANPSSNISNAELAAAVELSERQLQRQFKLATGIPIRRFRLWHRLFVTATLMQFGWSLTDAALEAGFSDAPHFNHTFRSMLGMKPSYVLKRQNKIEIFVGGSEDHDHSVAVSS